MKIFFFVFLILFLNTSLKCYSQILDENFDYGTGTLTTVSSIWTESPTGSVDIQVITGNLTYSNYPSSGIGNMIALNGGALRSGVITNFASILGNGSNLYGSFLLNVTSTADMDSSTSTGDYFANFHGGTKIRSYIYVRQGSSSSTFQIGLAKSSSSSLSWYTSELNVNQTYLIVISYVFQSGSDAVKLWIDPSLSGTEPAADIIITSGTDADSLNAFQFRQRTYSGDMDVDGLRVAISWSQAPLPVELISFSAIVKNNSVVLFWETATEVNNYGFNVERASLQKSGTARSPFRWINIGFVLGHGNSSSLQGYRFVDENPLLDTIYYRLKQIDINGKFEYSREIKVIINSPFNFKLAQNYPNPFNPLTAIEYGLKKASNVKLDVYNILGQKVKTLVNKYKPAGKYKVNFNGSDLPSGIYFYYLKTRKFNKVRKMILLK